MKNIHFSIGVVCFGILLIFLVTGNIKMYGKRQDIQKQIQFLGGQIEEMTEHTKATQEGISRSQTEAYIERVAREELNFKKVGEFVVAFPFLNQEEGESTSSEAQEGSWFDKLFKRQ